MKKSILALLLSLLSAPAMAQTAITLPYAAQAVADIGNGPIKVRVTQGNASIFTSQGSGVGSTSGSSTALTLTATPAIPPLVGALISGSGITSGTSITAYDGTTGITLSAAMTVSASTAVSWGAACPSSAAGTPAQFIQASVSADYYMLYTQARVCAISPGGPSNTLLILPVFYDQTTPGGGGGVPSGPAGGDLTGTYPNPPLAAIIAGGGPTGSATVAPIITYDAKGRLTAVSSATITPAIGSVTGLGTGVATALGVNIGSAGAPVLLNGVGGTPSSMTGTNITGIPGAGVAAVGNASGAPSATFGVIKCDGTTITCAGGVASAASVTAPGGSNTQVQYNNSGTLAGASTLTYSSSTLFDTANAATSFQIQDAASSQDKLQFGTQSSTTCDAGYIGTVGSGPCALINFAPNATGTYNTVALRGTNSRTLVSAIGGAANPELILADTNVFGVPVWNGGNQVGAGFLFTARTGSGAPAEFNFVNGGAASGTPSGVEGSMLVNIYGGSSNGLTQSAITFWNATGCTKWSTSTCSATAAASRLGEIAGIGMSADGLFTQTETWSINGYAAITFTGTFADGSYNAPTNIVLRTAPNASAVERNVAMFDYNANLFLGASASTDCWATNGNVEDSAMTNSIMFCNAPNDPTNNPRGGFLYVKGGALKYKGSAGTVATLAGP